MNELEAIVEAAAIKAHVEEAVKEFVIGAGITFEEVRMEVFQAGLTGEMRWDTVCKLVEEINKIEETIR